MRPQAGLPILSAPHFPPVTNWPARLRLSAGVRIEGESAFPQTPWREPTAEEVSLLVRDPALPLYQKDLDASLTVWALPQRLLTKWWQLLETTTASGEIVGFDQLVLEIYDFLAFKNMVTATGPGLHAEVIALPPGRPSLRVDPQSGQPAGLGWTEDLWGIVHLGDGPAEVVYVNRAVDLDAAPDYPVVGLRLEPGEGVRLPTESVLMDAPAPSDAPGLWLLLRAERRPATEVVP